MKSDDPVRSFNAPDGTEIFSVEPGVVEVPKGLDTPDPEYTSVANYEHYEGKSVLWVVIDKNGELIWIRIAQPLGGGLDDKAVETVRKWRFAPATKDGVPVAVQVNIQVNFRCCAR